MARRDRRRKFRLSLIGSSFCIAIAFFQSCSPEAEPQENKEAKLEIPKGLSYFGNTQGTTFSILCNDSIDLSFEEITETLHQFDLALSTYIPNSTISHLNEAGKGVFTYEDRFSYFNNCINASRKIFEITQGAFDPTVYPLVEAWGFFKDIENIPDSASVKSILRLIGFEPGKHFMFYESEPLDTLFRVRKLTKQAKLVFNSIAQGQAVDVLCDLIEYKGGKNYFVEIGGEIRVKGLNSENKLWTIGIDEPIEGSTSENRQIMNVIQLDNKAVATSGSYRKFYEKEGQKYSHTIDPSTGRPVQHQLLSVTVVADNCADADGLATAFLVMGTEGTIDFLNQENLNVDVFLVFNNSKGRLETYMTKGFQSLILEQ